MTELITAVLYSWSIFPHNLFIFFEYVNHLSLPPRYVCLSDLNSHELHKSQCVTDNDERFNYS